MKRSVKNNMSFPRYFNCNLQKSVAGRLAARQRRAEPAFRFGSSEARRGRVVAKFSFSL